MPTNQPQLEALAARFPKNRRADIQAIYELGLGDLQAVLDKPKPRPTPHGFLPAGCINDFPAPFVHLINTIVLARGVDICWDHLQEALNRDERRLIAPFKTHLHGLLHHLLTALAARNAIKPQNGLTALAAGKEFSYEMADLCYDLLHEMNQNADPREVLAAARVYNELGLVAETPEEETQPQMKAA